MKYAFAAASLLGLAAASAHGHAQLHRRQDVRTVTDWTVVTVTDVVTVMGPSPVAQETPTAAPAAPSSSHKEEDHTTTAPASNPPAVTASPPAQQAEQPKTSPAEQPHTTLQTSAVPKPQTSSAAPAAPASSGTTGGSDVGDHGLQQGASVAANCTKDKPCAGDMTTYTPGMGSCGWDDSTGDHKDDAVALEYTMFGSLSSKGVNDPANKLCGKRISITNAATGVTAVGTIRDKCPGCSTNSATGAGIDLAPALDAKLNGGVADGRKPITWYFLD